MATTAAGLTDPYFELIQKFPLRHLRSDAELDEANAVLRSLISRPLVEGERNYLEVLLDLIEKYESDTIPMGAVSDTELLRSLLEDHGLTQSDLAEIIGDTDSAVSEILRGTRHFTRKQAGVVCKRFRLRPGAFRSVD